MPYGQCKLLEPTLADFLCIVIHCFFVLSFVQVMGVEPTANIGMPKSAHLLPVAPCLELHSVLADLDNLANNLAIGLLSLDDIDVLDVGPCLFACLRFLRMLVVAPALHQSF